MRNQTQSITFEPACKRFVAFIDIMGFRDKVIGSAHKTISKMMNSFYDRVFKPVEKGANPSKRTFTIFEQTIVKPVLFSDSILLISSDNSKESAENIIFTVKWLLRRSMQDKIPLKGAIAYGLMTADFDKFLYFGKPLIGAFELQKDLQLYGVVLHHTMEHKLNGMSILPEETEDRMLFAIKLL